MAYQFIHLDNFAMTGRAPRQTQGGLRPGKLSALDILREAARYPGASPHVAAPQRPKLAFGVQPLQLWEQLERDVAAARDPRGRKLRADLQVLLSGVISYPQTVDQLKKDQQSRNDFQVWFRRSVDFLKSEWGDQLRSVVFHADETYPHLHFFVTPDFMHGETTLDQVHPGMRAMAETGPKSARTKEAARARRLAYVRAMRQFQDRVYASISMHHGHTRLGPGKRRLTRAQWQTEQSQAKALKTATFEAKQIIDSTNRYRADTLKELAQMQTQAKQEITYELGRIRHIINLLEQWVEWMQSRAHMVPKQLKRLLDHTKLYLNSSDPG